LLEAEEILLSNPVRNTLILRPGGLLGTDRHPVFTLSGKQLTSDGNAPVNLVRRQDVLGILELLISNPSHSGIFNAVFPEHPLKREYYALESSYFGIPPPVYIEKPGSAKGKKIYSHALHEMGYHFAHSIWTAKADANPGSTASQN
jgi:nucleoside-diphosphate-sugar epimerase